MESKSSQLFFKETANVDEAFKTALADVLSIKQEIQAEESESVGSAQEFKEILNYHLIINEPQQRLLKNAQRGFNLPGAIARFVWMMAANNRLADIEFYWGDKISRFTDDDITVPGSSYGARMFNASPGLDQIEAVIKRLKEDHSTRRAAVSIYHPIDAIRKSHDIPCTFGLFYHIREGRLISTVVMRSNNAFILLPYNIFEFSLLAEIIAKEVGVEFGSMHYHALSMHIYKRDYSTAEKILEGENESNKIITFPDMPSDPSPMAEVMKLIRLEAQVRHRSAGLNSTNIDEWLQDTIEIGKREKDKITLNDYWKQFYYLLLYHIVMEKTSDREALQKVASLIIEPYKSYLKELPKQSPVTTQSSLFEKFGNNDTYAVNSYVINKLNSLEVLCNEHNNNINVKESGRILSMEMYLTLRQELVGDINNFQNIAARGDSSTISKQIFEQAINKLFGD